MDSNSPLVTIRNGFKKLEGQHWERREKLLALVKARKAVSKDDQDWLDGAANLVDEVRILEALEKAPDYETGLEQLNPGDRMVVETLKKIGDGECSGNVGRKRKRECHFHSREIGHTPTTNPGPEASKVPGTTAGRSSKAKGQHKKENATNKQRIEILDWYHKNGKNQSLMAKHFDKIYPSLHIKQPLISSWIKNEAKWWATYESTGDGMVQSAKWTRMTQHPMVTEMMDLWVIKACEDGLLLTGKVLRQKWQAFADMVSVPEDECLTLSKGWLTRYKRRVGLKQMKWHGEAGSAPAEVVKKEQQRIQELIQQSGFAPQDVFNMDETGLFYA